jgi:hypothetical protein
MACQTVELHAVFGVQLINFMRWGGACWSFRVVIVVAVVLTQALSNARTFISRWCLQQSGYCRLLCLQGMVLDLRCETVSGAAWLAATPTVWDWMAITRFPMDGAPTPAHT